MNNIVSIKNIEFKETRKQRTNNGIVVNGEKICSTCDLLLKVSEFNKSSITKSGLTSHCKKCNVLISYIEGRKIKQEMIDAYGGKCTCNGCEITELEFLTVEHIFGGGGQHRALLNGNTVKFYKDLKNRGWLKDRITIMCWNCNCARRYNRPCPHNKKEYNKWLLELKVFEESLSRNNKWL